MQTKGIFLFFLETVNQDDEKNNLLFPVYKIRQPVSSQRNFYSPLD